MLITSFESLVSVSGFGLGTLVPVLPVAMLFTGSLQHVLYSTCCTPIFITQRNRNGKRADTCHASCYVTHGRAQARLFLATVASSTTVEKLVVVHSTRVSRLEPRIKNLRETLSVFRLVRCAAGRSYWFLRRLQH
jgi:hypothetical protein